MTALLGTPAARGISLPDSLSLYNKSDKILRSHSTLPANLMSLKARQVVSIDLAPLTASESNPRFFPFTQQRDGAAAEEITSLGDETMVGEFIIGFEISGETRPYFYSGAGGVTTAYRLAPPNPSETFVSVPSSRRVLSISDAPSNAASAPKYFLSLYQLSRQGERIGMASIGRRLELDWVQDPSDFTAQFLPDPSAGSTDDELILLASGGQARIVNIVHRGANQRSLEVSLFDALGISSERTKRFLDPKIGNISFSPSGDRASIVFHTVDGDYLMTFDTANGENTAVHYLGPSDETGGPDPKAFFTSHDRLAVLLRSGDVIEGPFAAPLDKKRADGLRRRTSLSDLTELKNVARLATAQRDLIVLATTRNLLISAIGQNNGIREWTIDTGDKDAVPELTKLIPLANIGASITNLKPVPFDGRFVGASGMRLQYLAAAPNERRSRTGVWRGGNVGYFCGAPKSDGCTRKSICWPGRIQERSKSEIWEDNVNAACKELLTGEFPGLREQESLRDALGIGNEISKAVGRATSPQICASYI